MIEPARAVGVQSGALNIADQGTPLAVRDAGAGGGVHDREPAAGNHPQRAPHPQVLHQGPVDVQRPVDVGDGQPGHPRQPGEVHPGGIGAV